MDNARRCQQGMFAAVPLQLRKSLQGKLQIWEGRSEVSYVDAKVDASTMIEHRYFSLDTCDLMNTREYDL